MNDPRNGSRYFVGAILRTVSPEDVKRHFEQYGPVRNFVLSTDDTGKSRGYGFVTFENAVDIPNGDKHPVGMANLTVNKVGVPLPPAEPAQPAAAVPAATGGSRNSPVLKSVPHADEARASPQQEPPKRPRTESEPRMQHAPQLPPRKSVPMLRAQLTASLREAARFNDRSRNPYQSAPRAFPQQAPSTIAQQPPVPAPAPPPVPAVRASPAPVQPVTPAAVAAPRFACIPLELCPPHFLRDPRVICAELDPTRVGSLVMMAGVGEVAPTPFSMPSHSQATRDESVPPPPGPPPPRF